MKLPFPSINALIEEKNSLMLAQILRNLSPFEIAHLISKKEPEAQIFIFNSLSPESSLATFDFLPTYIQASLLKAMPKRQAAHFLKSLSPDDRTSFLQILPEEITDELIKLLPFEERVQTISLLGYPKGSIGRLMTTNYVAVKLDWSIETILDHLQAFGHYSETIDFIYVIDDEGKLIDDIKLQDILFVPRSSPVSVISDKKFIALSVYEEDEAAVNIFRQLGRNALPVIDEKGILLGIVTVDDVLRLANETATEEMQKIGGMEALNEPYMQAPFLELIRKRAGWLVILFIGEMLTATALGYFEGEIAKAVVLALFLPLIISSGGNAGSQASTLVIRAMALGEVKLSDWWKIVRKEVLSGLVLGTILGIIGFFRISLWSLFSNIYGEHWLLIALTVCIALICVVMWGTLMGALFPLLLRKLGADPAKSSAPFVATAVDVTGIMIYFFISILILSGTLL